MSGHPETISTSRFDGLKWSLVAAIVAAGAYGNFYFSAESLLYRVIGLLVLLAIAVAVAMQTEKGASFWGLMKDAKLEIRKVVWPTRQETTQTTMVVVAVVLVMGLILWGVDSLLGWAISSLI